MMWALLGEAFAQACLPTAPVPESVQVAWLSPASKRVRSNAWMEVVRMADVEAWIANNGREKTRLLQAMGLLKRRPGARAESAWKVTLFDVTSEQMCRPIDEIIAGEQVSGVAACDDDAGGRLGATRHGFTGCGYSLDTGAGTQGFDVFRIQWEQAASQGFCVLPLDRFLSEL